MAKLSREVTSKLNWILDNLLPPLIRDNRVFMKILFKIVLGRKYKYYLEFKERCNYLSNEEINQYYAFLEDTFVKRETHCNSSCVDFILKQVKSGERILDVGGGNGYLAKKINKYCGNEVYLLDVVDKKLEKGIIFQKGSILDIPFEDNFFDTVICTHTLEHIRDNKKALEETRRVCKNKLIIVLPKQREYKYTCDLHIHFFPYQYNVRNFVGNKAKIMLLDKDWLILEKKCYEK